MRYLLALFLAISIITGNYEACLAASSKVTIKVVGEDGKPFEGANVSVTFELPKHTTRKGFSDGDGVFTATSESMDGVSYSVTKDGYYKSAGRYVFKEGVKLFRWQPWNPMVELLLRKRENPVPMYTRDTKENKLIMPVVGKEAGFDLVAFDWVSPYGKGKHSDLIFKLEKRVVDARDFDSKLIITFSNKYDGIQVIKEDLSYGSTFKLPRYAPESGYQPKLIKTRKRVKGRPSDDNFEKDNNYFFRVRSEVEDGKLVKAIYGKIEGEIRFEPRGFETGGIYFKYYLNPDYTRNMEMGENLFESRS